MQRTETLKTNIYIYIYCIPTTQTVKFETKKKNIYRSTPTALQIYILSLILFAKQPAGRLTRAQLRDLYKAIWRFMVVPCRRSP